MVLVGSDSHELGFLKSESLEVFREMSRRLVFVFTRNAQNMKPRLIPVHTVQNNLMMVSEDWEVVDKKRHTKEDSYK